jgi:calcineurin-like phosphoesterase
MTIWIGSDWHLIDYTAKTDTYSVSPNANKILAKYQNYVGPSDLFIFLGDLCCKGFSDEAKLINMMEGLRGYKVMVKGNHDTMDNSSYYKAGFDIVTDAASFGKKILLTHKPVIIPKNMDIINIHGHLHDKKFSRFDNKHINPYGYCHGSIVEFRTLMAAASQMPTIDDAMINICPNKEEMIHISDIPKESIFDLTEFVMNGPDGHPMDESQSKLQLNREIEILNDLVFGFDDVKLASMLGREDGKPNNDSVLEP